MDPIVEWILGAVVTASIAIVGGFIRYLFGIIKSHREDTDKKIAELKAEIEAKATERRDTMLELINTKFDMIWESIRDIKDKLS